MFFSSRYRITASRWMSLQNVVAMPFKHTNCGFCQLSTFKNFKFLATYSSSLIFDVRKFCTRKMIPIVYYDEIKDLPNHPEKLLIDVRDPNEVRFGKIPQSINIPLCGLKNELALNGCDLDPDPEAFRKKYGREKPTPDTYIIMYCRTGQRAAVAAEIASMMGYKNVHNYCGSWLDYVRNETCD